MFRKSRHLLSLTSFLVSAFVSSRRLTARAKSLSERKSLFGFAGVPGQTNTPAMATGIVIRALIMNVHLQGF
jgi:hypothetical protein